MRIAPVFLLLALLAALAPSPKAEARQRQPSFLLVMTDDQGWGDVRSHGNVDLDTPVMDTMAREGVRFERFFVSPVCSPTRASLLTGRYSLRTGVRGVTRGHETMRSEEVTLAELLREAGYSTGIFGKWHNGAHYPHDPNGQGFDLWIGFAAGHWNNYFDSELVRNGASFRTSGYINDVLTDSALAFIERNADHPFFAYVPFNTPHSPFQVPSAYFDPYKARGLADRDAAVYGMVTNLDDNIGRLIAGLERLGLRESTIVLFLTDNGPNGERYNGGMRGIKGSLHEGGVRVPFFVHWPGMIEGGHAVRHIAAHIDVMPTILDLAGVPIPEALAVDGLSLRPLLTGQVAGWPDRVLFAHRFRMGEVEQTPGAVRTERYRAVNYGSGWELYDMWSDPGQLVDVASANRSVVDDLGDRYDRWYSDVTLSGFEEIPAEIGHPEAAVVELPGHEARLHGEGIGYVGPSGWANDWITGWTDTTAYASWPTEVVRSGTYAVRLLYAIGHEDVGARVAVETNGARVSAEVGPAHDPEPRFSPDRVLRGEVYERDWAVLDVGTLHLERSAGFLFLRLEELAGRRGPEVKAVRLAFIGN